MTDVNNKQAQNFLLLDQDQTSYYLTVPLPNGRGSDFMRVYLAFSCDSHTKYAERGR